MTAVQKRVLQAVAAAAGGALLFIIPPAGFPIMFIAIVWLAYALRDG